MDQWISLLCSAHAAAGCALSSSHPTVLAFCFLCGAHAAVGCALSSSHPTTQAFRLHCRVASDCPRPSLPCNAWFFSIGLLVSYRFMFFFIDWKLPPPACPGTTGTKSVCCWTSPDLDFQICEEYSPENERKSPKKESSSQASILRVLSRGVVLLSKE